MNDTKRTAVFNPLKYPIYVMAKPIGALCNLDCHYCYYLEKGELYKGVSPKMSETLLEKYIVDHIECQPTPNVLFTWHGGEPLLRGIDFFRKAMKIQSRYAKGRNISNSLQTNGLLLNDEWCRFFKENNFLIGISIDGPEFVHDHYRRDKSGKGTFAKVMKGIELLKKHQVDFNTLSVINDYSAKYPLQVYNFFKSIGSHYMQFSPIVERWGDRPADRLELLPPTGNFENVEMPPWCVSPKDYGNFYCTIFDEWVKHDVGNYFIQLFDSTLAGWVGEEPGVCIYAKMCGHAAVMEHNGDIYCCDHFVFPEYRLGNIQTSTLTQMMLSEKQMNFGANKYNSLPWQCKECKFLKLCNGECPKNRIATSCDGEPGLNYLCEGLRQFFSHTEPYMRYMAEQLAQKLPPANVMNVVDKIKKEQERV